MQTPAEALANLSLAFDDAADDAATREVAKFLADAPFLLGKASAWFRDAVLERKETIPILADWTPKDAGDVLLVMTAMLSLPLSPVGAKLFGAMSLVFLPLAAGHLGSAPGDFYANIADTPPEG